MLEHGSEGRWREHFNSNMSTLDIGLAAVPGKADQADCLDKVAAHEAVPWILWETDSVAGGLVRLCTAMTSMALRACA